MQDNSQNKTAKLVKAIGEIIKRHREEQNKTMYKISAEAGVPKATWRELELGLKDFRFSTIWKVAEGLDMPLDKLIKEVQDKLGDKFSLSDLNSILFSLFTANFMYIVFVDFAQYT